ncbi:uncharacterized protein DC041_0011716, partial [Schistosoma bovis]
MLEYRRTYQRPTIVVFLDIRVAFNSLDRTVLWDCLLKKDTGCPISPFLFNFAIDDILETALMDVGSCGVDLLPGERLLDLEYADDIVLLVLLQDWQDSGLELTLD